MRKGNRGKKERQIEKVSKDVKAKEGEKEE